MKKMRVYYRREQIVRRRNRVEITVEVKIDPLCGFDLTQAASGASAFRAE
jgi:hypothetical protein